MEYIMQGSKLTKMTKNFLKDYENKVTLKSFWLYFERKVLSIQYNTLWMMKKHYT